MSLRTQLVRGVGRAYGYGFPVTVIAYYMCHTDNAGRYWTRTEVLYGMLASMGSGTESGIKLVQGGRNDVCNRS